MRKFCSKFLALALFLSAFTGMGVEARTIDVSQVAEAFEAQSRCVVRRVRSFVNGRLIVRTVRRCRPSFNRGRDCRVIRERIRRPNGTVVVRTVRRCR